MILVQSSLNTTDRFFGYLSENQELSLGQRVHLHKRQLIHIFNNIYYLLGIFIVALIIIIALAVNAELFVENFGEWKYRFHSIDGISCDPNEYLLKIPADFPTNIVVIPDSGAFMAGVKTGDKIVEINGKPITKAGDLTDWDLSHPDVIPGDIVNVKVQVPNGDFRFHDVKTSPRVDEENRPMLGVNVADENSCSRYFIVNQQFDDTSVRVVQFGLITIIGAASIFVFLFGLSFITQKKKISKLKAELNEWENDYIDRSYITKVNTEIPKGDTPGEKIFNLAQSLFPELQKKIGKAEKWKRNIKGKDGYEFDCYQPTYDEKGEPHELFIAKYFHDEEVTFEKIQELCDKAKESRDTESINKRIKDAKYKGISRLICLSNKYSKEIMEDKNDYLQKNMDELDFEFNIDLLYETEEGGFNIIWIDYD